MEYFTSILFPFLQFYRFVQSFIDLGSFSPFQGANMAARQAMADRRIVSLVLSHLSDMKYTTREQKGPDRPVELVEFPPTLVPCILVNQLWRDEGTSLVWKCDPYLPALQGMDTTRRQWYANKVVRLSVPGPATDGEDLAYLEGLSWPNLTHLTLDLDCKEHGKSIASMLHAGIRHLELIGPQCGDSNYIAGNVLPSLLGSCNKLESIHIGPDVIDPRVPVHNQEFSNLLDSVPNIKDVRIMNASFFGKDLLFGRLSQRAGLEALEIDLDPGTQLVPLFTGSNLLTSPFASLKRLHLICYPEVALALPIHLRLLEELHLNIARIPDQSWQESDLSILDDLLGVISQCAKLSSLRVNIGQLANDFPTARSFPTLSGTAVIKLANGCPNLQDIDLSASEPAAINGSNISALQFDSFCRRLGLLKILSLKLHPRTSVQLETTALQSLGTFCPQLEELRLKVALQLPSLRMPRVIVPATASVDATSSPTSDSDSITSTPSIAINGHQRGASLDLEYVTGSSTPTRPLFPRLTYLAFARPQTILSINNDTYTVSSSSQSSSTIDPSIEEDLTHLWAQPLYAHFPNLEELEAWSDWTGQDNDSARYVLPHVDLLSSIQEFLSGVEQDIWEDGETGEAHDEAENWDGETAGHFSYDSGESGDDWERASQLNEFPADDDFDHGPQYSHYDDESEGMITPGRTMEREGDGFF